eukprot:6177469-Pleurochrysis_carterae.AAC.2
MEAIATSAAVSMSRTSVLALANKGVDQWFKDDKVIQEHGQGCDACCRTSLALPRVSAYSTSEIRPAKTGHELVQTSKQVSWTANMILWLPERSEQDDSAR